MPTGLQEWYDADAVPERIDLDELCRDESERLVKMLYVAYACARIPRRLGPEASSRDLANDKKTASRVIHALHRSWIDWERLGGGLRRESDSERDKFMISEPHRTGIQEASGEGARIKWDEWHAEHGRRVAARRVFAASCAIAFGEIEFGNAAIHLLTRELELVEYAFR